MLDTCAENNPDGAGFSYVDNGEIRISRSMKWKNLKGKYKSAVRKHGKTSPFILHFRIATHGTVCLENCHPFKMADGGVMAHNGVISVTGDEARKRNKTDSEVFVTDFLDKLPEGWYFDQVMVNVVDRVIAGSKLVFLWPSGQYYILGENRGQWGTGELTGVWFSNSSHKERKTFPMGGTALSGPTGARKEVVPTSSPKVYKAYMDISEKRRTNMWPARNAAGLGLSAEMYPDVCTAMGKYVPLPDGSELKEMHKFIFGMIHTLPPSDVWYGVRLYQCGICPFCFEDCANQWEVLTKHLGDEGICDEAVNAAIMHSAKMEMEEAERYRKSESIIDQSDRLEAALEKELENRRLSAFTVNGTRWNRRVIATNRGRRIIMGR